MVYACWTAPPGASQFDWVVLVAVGAPNTQYVSWQYTDGAESGCATLSTFAAPGTYEVRYLLNGGSTDVATSNTVNVVASPGAYSVSATPSPSAVSGRDVHACWTAPPGSSPGDAIGLFRADLPPTGALATRGTCGAESGCAVFTAPATGSYEVRYLYGGSLDVTVATLTTAPSPGSYSLNASPAQVPAGATTNACWTAPPGASQSDWVVLVAIDDPSTRYVSWQYTGGTASGCAALTASPGTYEVRYLLNNGNTDVATSNEVVFGPAHSLMHAHQWKFRITENAQSHPLFGVGEQVSMRSFVPRQPIDQWPADSTIGEYRAGFAILEDMSPPWTFSSPRPEFTVLDDFMSADGVRFDATSGGRSLAIACSTSSSLYNNDEFKTRDVPVPGLHCPGAASDVTIGDTHEPAVITAQLECIRYLPEPSLAFSIGVGCFALSVGSRQRRRRHAS